MTSLLRDIYVDIPGHEGNRLNAAYAYGGPELLMETLEKNFDITVNRYMLVNFQAFASLVDAVGGVDIEVTNEEVQYINGYLVEYNQIEGRAEGTDYLDTSLSGQIHLNGPQALAFCRNRFIGSDFARTERQRKVISAAMKNVPIALATNGSELVNGILSNITTNLTSSELSGLLMQVPMMLTYDMVSGSIPLEGTYSNANIRGMAVLQIDFDANKEYIQKEIYGK
jgi:LCP family protein required for cell wall assembly